MNMIFPDDHHKHIHIFMPYYYGFDADFNEQFERVYGENSHIMIGHSN